MSSWPGAGAAITLVYEARQGASREGMSKRTGMIELIIMVGHHITLGLSWPPLLTRAYMIPPPKTLSTVVRRREEAVVQALGTLTAAAEAARGGPEDKNGVGRENGAQKSILNKDI